MTHDDTTEWPPRVAAVHDQQDRDRGPTQPVDLSALIAGLEEALTLPDWMWGSQVTARNERTAIRWRIDTLRRSL